MNTRPGAADTGTVTPEAARAGSVCVIGAQGALGNAVVEQFRASGWCVHPAGRRADKRAGFREVDLNRRETVAAAIADVDLVVSTVAHPAMTAERLVLERGGVLVNCSHASADMVASVRAATDEPRGTILLNAGLVPGVANLVAAELLERHAQADCLEIAFTVLSKGTTGKAGARFAHEALTSRHRHRVMSLPLPAPFGRLPCIQVSEQDDGGFQNVAKGRHVERYLAFGERPLRTSLLALNALGLTRLLPAPAFTAGRGRLSQTSSEPTVVWVGVRKGGNRLGASVIECAGDYRTTAAAARLFGEKLLERNQPGSFHPEDLFDLGALSRQLADIGVRSEACVVQPASPTL